MYLHLGQSVAVPHREILGIFDLDNASWAYKTREFLERAEQEGRVISVCDDLPRSFVLVGEEKGTATVYISQLSSAALLRRRRAICFESCRMMECRMQSEEARSSGRNKWISERQGPAERASSLQLLYSAFCISIWRLLWQKNWN